MKNTDHKKPAFKCLTECLLKNSIPHILTSALQAGFRLSCWLDKNWNRSPLSLDVGGVNTGAAPPAPPGLFAYYDPGTALSWGSGSRFLLLFITDSIQTHFNLMKIIQLVSWHSQQKSFEGNGV